MVGTHCGTPGPRFLAAFVSLATSNLPHRVTWKTAVSAAVAGTVLLLLVNLRSTARMRVQISSLGYWQNMGEGSKLENTNDFGFRVDRVDCHENDSRPKLLDRR
jgi:hypothetical protein